MSTNASCLELLEMTKNSSYDFHLDPIECLCGDYASPTLIDSTYRFNSKSIIVKNVPVLKCKQCGELISDALIDIRVEQQALKAMQEDKATIEFSE